ncbi:MAG: DUF1107 domain-containing protein [Succinivibrio sp.]|nr:DUF1107 domain-containing protein [Succinivibrio sp.]
MRQFKKYAPRQIAKYVASFFKGTFLIEGKGEFKFDAGKVLVEDTKDTGKLVVCREVNEVIAAMGHQLQNAPLAY